MVIASVKEIDLLSEIARDVREVILDRYPHGGGGEVVGEGADGAPTFLIDALAEEVAIGTLDRSDIGMNVLSEEAGHIDRGSDLTLLMDPIDGSYNAVNGIPIFSISLAISKGEVNNVRHALVRDIVRGTTYHASLGSGAFRDGERIHTRKWVPEKAIISTHLPQGCPDSHTALLSMARKARSLGCISLETCLVAQGSLDLYAMLSRAPRMIDLTACTLILKEAGGNTFWYKDGGEWGEYILNDKADDIDGVLSMGDPAFAPMFLDPEHRWMDKEAGEG